jgi:predicted RNA-binding protein (virulence factor B family)
MWYYSSQSFDKIESILYLQMKKDYLYSMLEAGIYHDLAVLRKTPNGVYLDDGAEGVLLPTRFVPKDVEVGQTIRVFIYHDSEGRLIATTQEPKGIVGDIVKLVTKDVTPQGAFMDWGLMKDLFIAKSQQVQKMIPKGEYLVMIYRDEQTGRVAATQRFAHRFQNDQVQMKKGDEVDLLIYRRTDIGYLTIINFEHTGVLHFSDIFQPVQEGQKLKGYIKNIKFDEARQQNLIDVAIGKRGYVKTDAESEKILQLLRQHGGYLPYYDKSDPEEIYEFFQMSKKTFKMTIGKLYKERRINLTNTGIQLLED